MADAENSNKQQKHAKQEQEEKPLDPGGKPSPLQSHLKTLL
jgi:hypothetical protein